jgi:hypothetical protein
MDKKSTLLFSRTYWAGKTAVITKINVKTT